MDNRPNPTTILVLGIVGLVLCNLVAPFAWIMGNNALANAGSYPESDLSMIKVGRVLGIIGTCLIACSCMWLIFALSTGSLAALSNR